MVKKGDGTPLVMSRSCISSRMDTTVTKSVVQSSQNCVSEKLGNRKGTTTSSWSLAAQEAIKKIGPSKDASRGLGPDWFEGNRSLSSMQFDKVKQEVRNAVCRPIFVSDHVMNTKNWRI